MEEMWRSMYISMQESGFSDSMMFSAVSSIIFFIFYYVHCWLFFFADKTGVLERYAIRSGKARQPPSELYWSAIVENSVDAFLLKPVAFYVMHAYVVGSSISMVDPVPSGLTVFAQVVGLSLIYSTSFYWLHRTFHEVKFLYKHVHKRHHAFHQTVGFAAQYFHPGETLANIMFILTAVILVKPHFVGFCGFLATFLMEIVDAHSGYDVPWSILYPWSAHYAWGSGARVHDYHHSHNIGTYGGGWLGAWDWVCGTDKEFREFEEKRLNAEKSK